MSFDNRSKQRIAKSVRHTEKNKTGYVRPQATAYKSSGQLQVFVMSETMQSDHTGGKNAKMRHKLGGGKDDSQDIKIYPGWIPAGKKVSSGTEVLCFMIDGKWEVIASEGCFEDI